jgi:hypothetical protein
MLCLQPREGQCDRGPRRCHGLLPVLCQMETILYCNLTSIVHPQIEGKFTATPGGLTNFFMVARTCSMIELVLPIIKYAVSPLEVGPECTPN